MQQLIEVNDSIETEGLLTENIQTLQIFSQRRWHANAETRWECLSAVFLSIEKNDPLLWRLMVL